MVVSCYEMKTVGPEHQVTCFSPAMKLRCLGYYSSVLFCFVLFFLLNHLL